jgi:hypothetical protein
MAFLLCAATPLAALDELPATSELAKRYAAEIRPLLTTYCIRCHGERKESGGIRLDTLDPRISEQNVAAWTHVRDMLDVGSMPPEQQARPKRDEQDRLVAWVAASLKRFEADHQETAGNVPLRRINLRAYQDMMRTLTGVRPDISQFPPDGTAQHFDTVGAALYVSESQLDQFFDCARRTLAEAVAAHAAKATAKAIDQELDFRKQRQESHLKDEWVSIEQGIAEHGKDLASFAGIRSDQRFAFYNVVAPLIDPRIAAHYGKKTFAEVTEAKIDWEHDADCQREVVARLTEAVAKFKQRLTQVSEFQPVPPDDGANWANYMYPKIEVPGFYEISARLHTFKAGCALPIKFIDYGSTLGSVLVDAPPEAPEQYSVTVYLGRGQHNLSVSSSLPAGSEKQGSMKYFIDYLRAHFGVAPHRLLNAESYMDDFESFGGDEVRPVYTTEPCELATISKLRVRGPLPAEAPVIDEVLALASVAEPTRSLAERCILAFMKRAYAGGDCEPETAGPYADVVMSHFGLEHDFANALTYGLAGVLASPRFLFLEEARRDQPARRRPLEAHELARRLAYFLWSDLPDAELAAAADSGALRDPRVLVAQMRRMLADPRSSAFRTAFTTRWLHLENIRSINIPYELFPGYDACLLESAERESVEFFSELLDHDLSVLDFIDADFAVINNRLAAHYGIPGVAGPAFRRVALTAGCHRGGILGQASVLIATSNGQTQSVVRRGAFIMEQILGENPGVPPPNVPALTKVPDTGADGALLGQRERLAQHRAIASCARCHDKIDPLGLGLQNYNALGAWTEREQIVVTGKDGNPGFQAHELDARGALLDGQAYDGPDALRVCLRRQPDRFLRRLTENLMIYALGRDLQQSDRGALDAICARTAKAGYGLSTLVEQVVLSDQFRCK